MPDEISTAHDPALRLREIEARHGIPVELMRALIRAGLGPKGVIHLGKTSPILIWESSFKAWLQAIRGAP